MAIHITKQGERVPVGAINVLIYGQPSTGKTSVCYTMQNPLVIDFDGGAHRSQQSTLGTTVRVDTWADVEEVMSSVVPQYSTIIIDTVGSALDYMAAYIIATNPKMGTAKGTLTMQGWGELKAVFQQWFKRLNVAGKDVVMIAHHREEKEGDATRKRPDIQGSSYGLVMKQADFVGFAHLNEASQRVLGFAPTADYFGKDSARLGVVQIADLDTEQAYGAALIDQMRSAFAKNAEAHQQTMTELVNWRAIIADWSSADDVNAHLAQLKSLQEPLATQVKTLAAERAKALHLTYDKKAAKYTGGAA